MRVAVHTDDLFRQIGIPVHVVPPAGDFHAQDVPRNFGFEEEPRQNGKDFLFRNVDAEERVYFGDARRHLTRRQIGGAHVFAKIGHDAAADLFDEVQRARHAPSRRVGVHALFEAEGGIGALSQRPRGLSHVVAREFGGFEKDVFRSLLDFAVQAAHDPREGHGLLSVADDEVFVRQRKFLFVEGDDLPPFAGAANDDLPVLDIVRVEGVHGLPHFEQHEIRDVHDGRNGTDARKRQPLSHPRGGLAAPDVFHIMPDIAGTEIGRVHPHLHGIFRSLMRGVGIVRLFEGLLKHRSHFARDP